MPDYGFYIKRKHENTPAPQSNTQPTDLPKKDPAKAPTDLPLPRHRPGEPIMYDPPDVGVEVFPITDPQDHEIH